MKSPGRILLFGALILAGAGICRGQPGSIWRVYKASDGLSDSSIFSVSVGMSGKVNSSRLIWVTHVNSDAIDELDGYQVKSIHSPEKNSRVYENGPCWIADSDGLREWMGTGWTNYHIAEIAALKPRLTQPPPILPLRQGRVLFLLPDAVMEFNGEDAQPRVSVVRRASQCRWGLTPDFPLFSTNDFQNAGALAGRLLNPADSDAVSRFLAGKLDGETRSKLRDSDKVQSVLAAFLNQIVQGPSIYDRDRFPSSNLRPETTDLQKRNPAGRELERLNRWLLEDAYRTDLLRNQFAAMIPASGGGVWVVGNRGLAKFTPANAESTWRDYEVDRGLNVRNLQEPFEDDQGGVTMVAEYAPTREFVAEYFDGRQWLPPMFVPGQKIRQAWRGPDDMWWVATVHGVFYSTDGRFKAVTEIATQNIRDVAVQPGGVFWVATSDGLYRHAPALWRPAPETRRINGEIHGIAEDKLHQMWFLSSGSEGNTLHVLGVGGLVKDFPLPAKDVPEVEDSHPLYCLGNGSVVTGAGDRLLQFDPAAGSFHFASASAQGIRLLGLLPDGTAGVQVLGANTGYDLRAYDGSSFGSFPHPPADRRLGEGLVSLFAAHDGALWLSGDSDVATFRNGRWVSPPSADGTPLKGVVCFAQMDSGKIWCATPTSIWELDGDGSKRALIRSGFDQISALIRAGDGGVWIATRNGLSRFYKDVWADNRSEEGLPGPIPVIFDVHEDSIGRLWAATQSGLSRYDPLADVDPPHAFAKLQKTGNDADVLREHEPVTVTLGGLDKWQFTPSDRLLFSWSLDGREWTSPSELTVVTLSGMKAGIHDFLVRAMDRNWNTRRNPAPLSLNVSQPWYKDSRLVAISFAGAVAALFFAVLAFNRHRRLVRSYAEVEEQVAVRTRQLEAASQELMQREKMNALGTLAAGVAHDFNNILSIIKGSAQIIEDNLENREKVRIRLDRIKTVVDQGKGIVEAMLGFGRGADGPSALCNVNHVVRETIKLLGDRFRHDVDVQLKLADALPEIPAARELVQQILLNFVFNAVESLKERRVVILRTGMVHTLPEAIALAPAPDTAYVFVAVRDFGSGIPPEIMNRIFEPFFTTKALSTRRGTGLGLSMAYELARKIGAGLAVESVVGEGSTFTLFLPVNDKPPETAE